MVFGLFLFSKGLYLGDNDRFARTFSETWKMVFTLSISEFSKQKLNLLVIYCLRYNND